MSKKPQLKMAATLWSLFGYPDPKNPWTVQEKINAIKNAGFDGVAAKADRETAQLVKKASLILVGGTDIGSIDEVESKLQTFKEIGAVHINVQVCDHDTPTEQALPVVSRIMEIGDKLGLKPAIELHRDTCTETPEKAYALAEAYEKKTNRLLRMNFDFSHPAIIKHLMPAHYYQRLVERVDLLTNGNLIHFRPFNGHHCQIPITDGKGGLSSEFNEWLPFCDQVIQIWLEKAEAGREFIVVPELGPKGSYGLSCFPDIWKDVIVLSNEIRKLWDKNIQNWQPKTMQSLEASVSS